MVRARRGDEGVEIGGLRRRKTVRRARRCQDDGGRKRLQGGDKRRVLLRLARAIEENVDAQSCHAQIAKRAYRRRDQPPIDGRAIGQIGQRLLGHEHERHARMLGGQMRREGRGAKIGQPILGGGCQRPGARQEHACGRHEDGHNRRRHARARHSVSSIASPPRPRRMAFSSAAAAAMRALSTPRRTRLVPNLPWRKNG